MKIESELELLYVDLDNQKIAEIQNFVHSQFLLPMSCIKNTELDKYASSEESYLIIIPPNSLKILICGSHQNEILEFLNKNFTLIITTEQQSILALLKDHHLKFPFDVLYEPIIPQLLIAKFHFCISKIAKQVTTEKINPGVAASLADGKVEKLIEDLEFKSLSSEMSEQKLKDEINLRKVFDVEIQALNQSLQDQTLRLSDLNKELKSFTYTVSHDLKAPLRGMIGYSQELMTRHSAQLSERSLFCIQQIFSASHNLEKLIEDLLKYSRLELEIPTPIEIDIKTMIQNLIKERTATISDYKSKIELLIDCDEIWGWERGLSQALANLIDNALKYSKKAAEPRVIIGCKTIDDKYLITVKDNGIGFEAAYKEKIFELFHRLVKQEDYEGTGAGLAIVKKVINKMNGNVRAESEPGKGAAFFIELPVKP